ncbi:Uncharacterized protein HZ326_10096 [Fusarium oxysporum f. sp. albedinis]|nr:Uncharacterized protein HZ326_10096 [Fusarium oxysporum f. sp. albedinis]
MVSLVLKAQWCLKERQTEVTRSSLHFNERLAGGGCFVSTPKTFLNAHYNSSQRSRPRTALTLVCLFTEKAYRNHPMADSRRA